MRIKLMMVLGVLLAATFVGCSTTDDDGATVTSDESVRTTRSAK